MGQLTKKQHTVTGSYLAQFTRQFRDEQEVDPTQRPAHFRVRPGTLLAYDKQSKTVTPSNSGKATTGKYFYDLDPAMESLLGGRQAVEKALSRIEDRAIPALRRLLELTHPVGIPMRPRIRRQHKILYSSSRPDRLLLGEFIASQFIRTKFFRQVLAEQLRGQSRLSQSRADQVATQMIAEWLTDNDDHTSLSRFSQAMCDGYWVFVINDDQEPFYTSDHPVVGWIEDRQAAFGGPVQMMPSSLVQLIPLSYRVALMILEPSYWSTQHLLDYRRNGRELDGYLVGSRPSDVPDFNALQLRHATQFAFSATEVFRDVHHIPRGAYRW